MGHRITHKRLSRGGTGHEAITDLAWVNDRSGQSGSSSKSAMVDFVDRQASGQVYTAETGGRASVGVVRPSGGTPYLRTYSDGKWTNNLLALPDF